MNSFNKVSLYGKVGKDPVVKHLEGDRTVANFSLATSEQYKNSAGEKIEKTEWHDIVMWGGLAKLAEKYVKKGNPLIVEGKITHRSYDDKNGITRYVTEIVCSEMYFAGGKKDSDNREPRPRSDGKVDMPSLSDVNDLLGPMPDGKDLPF